MVTHLENGGLSGPWYLTLHTAELQFVDFSWTLNLPTCSFVLDHSFTTPSANSQPACQPLPGLGTFALTPVSYFLTYQTPIHPSKHSLQNLSDITSPSLSPTSHSFIVFLKYSVHISSTDFLACNSLFLNLFSWSYGASWKLCSIQHMMSFWSMVSPTSQGDRTWIQLRKIR